MKHLLFTLLLLSQSIFLYPARLSGNYSGDTCPLLYIGLFENGKYVCIDSVQVDKQGEYETILPQNVSGTLVIACANGFPAEEAVNKFDNTSSLLFVYDGQDIIYDTSWRWHNSSDYLNVTKGGETTAIVKLAVSKRDKLYENLSALENVIDRAQDKESVLFQSLSDEYLNLLKEYNHFVDNLLLSASPGTAFYSSLQCLKEPLPETIFQGEDRIVWMRNHFFDEIDFNHPVLYNTSFFGERLKMYLYIWQPSGLVARREIEEMQDQGIGLLYDKMRNHPVSIQNTMKKMVENAKEVLALE